MLVEESLARAVPSEIADDDAALADAFAVGEYYVRRSGAGSDAVPIVIGTGAIGLSAVAALQRRQIGPIIVSDYSPERHAIAERLGAAVTVDPRERSPFDAWRELALAGQAPQSAFEAGQAGQAEHDRPASSTSSSDFPACSIRSSSSVSTARRSTRRVERRRATTSRQWSRSERASVSTSVADPKHEDWYGTLDAICRQELDVSPVIGMTIDLDGVPEALNLARRADGPARIMIHPQERGR